MLTTLGEPPAIRCWCWWGLPVLLYASGCPGNRPAQTSEQQVLATVNETPITVNEFQQSLQEIKDAGKGFFSDESTASRVKRELLERLIDRTLLLQEAKRRKISIEPDLVSAWIDRIAKQYPEGEFEKALTRKGKTIDSYRTETEGSLLLRRLLEQEVLGRVAVSSAEIKSYFDSHRKEFIQPEEVRVRQIVAHTQEEAERLREEILRGASFEELARKFSLGPEAGQGGDLGYFPRGRMPPAVEEVCFNLFGPHVSQVVPSPYGFHLFMLVDRRNARDLTFEEARASIERSLIEERSKETEALYMRGLREKAKIERDLNLVDRVH